MMRYVRQFLILSLSLAILSVAAGSPADAQKKKSAPPRSDEPRAGAVHVYLLRGLINIFSTGMDDLAEKLERRGIRTSVHNHTQYYSLVQEITARHRAGRGERVVIIGHSLGGNDAVRMAASLGANRIPVALVNTYDPTIPTYASSNVSRVVNFYQSNNGWGTRVHPGQGFRGSLSNIDFSKEGDLGHATIDKSSKLHALSIGYIQAIGGSRRSSSSEKPAPEASSKQPAAEAATKQPAAEASSKQPAAEASSKQPAAEAATKQPAPAASSKQPSAAAASKQPAPDASSKQPSAAAASKQPPAVATPF